MSLITRKKAPMPKAKAITKSENEEIIIILSDISLKDGKTKLFTSKDNINKLASLRCGDDEFLLNVKYPDLLYEIIGGFNKLYDTHTNFDVGFKFLQTLVDNPDFTVKDEDISVLFAAPWFDRENELYREALDRMKTKISVKKGIFNCPDCVRNKRTPINNTESVTMTTRAADEPESVINTCNNCGYKWMF